MPNLHAGIRMQKLPNGERVPKTRLINGKKVPEFRIIPMTDHQMGQLGFKKGEKPVVLGHGESATAYAIGSSVVKITTDARDAAVAYMIMNLPQLPVWAIPVYAIWKLRGHTFAICTAKAEKLPKRLADPIDDIFDFCDEEDLQNDQWVPFHADLLKRIEELENEETLKEAALAYTGNITVEDIRSRTKKIREALSLLNQAVVDLANYGLDFADLHSLNWGYYEDRAVLLDLGMNLLQGDDDFSHEDLALIPVLRDYAAEPEPVSASPQQP